VRQRQQARGTQRAAHTPHVVQKAVSMHGIVIRRFNAWDCDHRQLTGLPPGGGSACPISTG
jgi:hypothetical protein